MDNYKNLAEQDLIDNDKQKNSSLDYFQLNFDNNSKSNIKVNDNIKLSVNSDSNKILALEDKKQTRQKCLDLISFEINNIINNSSLGIIEEHDLSKSSIVTIRNIHKTYLIGLEGVPALRGVSLNVKVGEFLVILGTSGGGKTSLLNTIGTIDQPSRVKY